ncbi:MAG: hypothetical protein PHC66_03770 [Candidatus Nanoarchaeia archaeon]|nr:hypothetical protein [Candidatus Nanoarchaeia archaeon]MDD5239213.1 hypothetical protein [Candidatus Nanoarchaeia archaeon]
MAKKEQPEKEIASRLLNDYISEKRGSTPEDITSREFKIFSGGKNRIRMLYEKLAKFAGSFIKYKVNEPKKSEIDTIFKAFNMNLTAEDSMAFALLAFMALFLLGAGFLFISMLFAVTLMLSAVIAFFYFRSYPQRLLMIRRSRVGTEMIMAVLYIVIYMKNVSNLEAAVKFAAENLEGPLADDLAKLLWDVSVKKYVDIIDALSHYLEQWRDYNDAFVDSVYLIETSLVQTSEERRLNMLDQALKRILDGTYETMVHYVNNLRTPVSAIFMLGITLPIMGLVMLPLIGAFMADVVNPTTLFILYDIILPGVVIILIYQVLATRPAAFQQIDVENHPDAPPRNKFILFGKPVHAIIPAVIVFLLFSSVYFVYALYFQSAMPSENDIFFSMFLVAALGFAIAFFCKLATGPRVAIRKAIRSTEDDFSYAVFQIGNRLSEGVPAEVAMLKTAQTMKNSNIADFIHQVVNNMQKLGMDLKRAIFDSVYGALVFYPSALIKSVMKIFIESTKESQEVAATSLMHISTYLQSVHRIEEKIRDVLAETISTIKFQTAFIAPLISGIIVGLTAMIMIILSVLGEKITSATTAASLPSTLGGGSSLGGSMAFGFFQMSSTIPLPIFQIVVGIYLVEIVVISTVLASKIEYGDDRVQMLDSIQRSLFISMTVYLIITLVVTIGFGSMARIAITLGEFA